MIFVNGVPGDSISVLDRGLCYGDGVFRTLPIRAGRVPLWECHLATLARDCGLLRIAIPERALLEADLRQAAVGVIDGTAKLIVTRGVGQRGYWPDPALAPTRIVQAAAGQPYPESWRRDGVVLTSCQTRLSEQAQTAGAKTLNRLDNILARSEWDDPGIFDGLMQAADGRWVEGTMSNLFLVSGGRLITPDLRRGGVAGMVRGLVLRDTLGLGCQVRDVDAGDIASADALFVCNSLAGVLPVKRLDAREYRDFSVAYRVQDELARIADSEPALILTP
ncbi:aminodeoxychorismate lyase [Chitinivorax sp. PXF-14]|uniref:aminodeoxychorismate lyase n=1 Tax=Chitinivorax sp. PXF-14 TaxID=3230488 RepID=UPI00346584C3